MREYNEMHLYFNKQQKKNATFHKLWCEKCEMQDDDDEEKNARDQHM